MEKNKTDRQVIKKVSFSLIGVILIMWAFAALLGILFAPVISLAEAHIIDRLFLLRYLLKGKEEASPYIIHALIDDKSLLHRDEPMRDRDIVASLVDVLHTQDTGCIGLDILYQHANPGKEETTLIESIQKAGNVFLPIVLYNKDFIAKEKKSVVFDFLETNQNKTSGTSPLDAILSPFPALTKAAQGFGHVNCDPDRDGINRSFPLIVSYGDYYIPSLPLRIMCSFLQVGSHDVVLSPGRHLLLKNATLPGNRIRDIAIPIDNKGKIRLNYFAPWKNSFYALSAFDIIEAQKNSVLRVQLRDILKDAIVFISDVSLQNKDSGPGVFDKLTPNSEILLTIMNMIMTRRFVTPLHPVLCFLLFTIFSILLYVFSLYIKSTPFEFLAYLACFILYVTTCINLFILKRTILPIFMPAMGFLIYILFMGIFHYRVQKKRVLHFISVARTEKAEKEQLIKEVNSVRVEKEDLQKRDQSFKHRMGQVMHDLRNLLQSFTQPMAHYKKHPGKQNRKAPDSAQAAIAIKKIKEIAEDILVLVQKEEGHLRLQARKNNLSVLIAECYETCQSEAKRKNINYQYVPAVSPVSLYCDYVKVSRTIMNLLSNALKFTSPGGSVTLTVKAPEVYNESLYSWKWPRAKPKHVAVIIIEDTGCGISQGDITAIFSQFTRLQNNEKQKEEGFGLGLAIAADFSELHYGHITCESQEGKGSVFTLYLPLGSAHLSGDEIIDTIESASGEIPYSGNKEKSNESTPFVQAPQKGDETMDNRTGLYRVENDNDNGIRKFGFEEPFKVPPLVVIVVDDEEIILEQFRTFLEQSGCCHYVLCRKSIGVMQLLTDLDARGVVIFLDLGMPSLPGDQLFGQIRRHFPDIKIVITTGKSEVESIVSFMRRGAYDYIIKPFDLQRIRTIIDHLRKAEKENQRLLAVFKGHRRELLSHPEFFKEIITNHRGMIEKLCIIEKNSGKSLNFLIRGESGVGKELIARAIYLASERTGKFIPVNISGISRELLNSTLFGYKKGAFTGAEKDTDGLIKAAAGGTLFLDEIGELQVETQVYLLRLLQEREYYKVGSTINEKADIQIVAATNSDLQKKIADGRFREDLYYRLSECEITVPPLRDRIEDIPLLTRHFHQKYTGITAIDNYPKELLLLLSSYAYPGNIRELESLVKRAIDNKHPEILLIQVIKDSIHRTKEKIHSINQDQLNNKPIISYSGPFPTLEILKNSFFTEALKQTNDDVIAAAELLGINKTTLYRWLKEKDKGNAKQQE
ncbi:MAG: sigma 54-interacting transcriptional regulator [Spirochaetales bacterium]|nr:sigma 54-interacting transcriptional regulator [Spirochaetales bacterium]